MLQTGHNDRSLDFVARMVESSYNRTPAKPIIDGEPRYENHPKSFSPVNGYFDAGDVRNAIYTGLFAGGCGFTYGCHAVWQFAQDAYAPINSPISHWKYSLELEGANQVQHAETIMTALRFHEMRPARDQVRDGSGHQALLSSEAKRLAIYTPDGSDVEMREQWKRARWYDPRTGESSEEIEVSNKRTSAPTSDSRVNDWVVELTR